MMYMTMRWVFAVIIAVGTGFAAFVINMAVENIAGTKFEITLLINEYSRCHLTTFSNLLPITR